MIPVVARGVRREHDRSRFGLPFSPSAKPRSGRGRAGWGLLRGLLPALFLVPLSIVGCATPEPEGEARIEAAHPASPGPGAAPPLGVDAPFPTLGSCGPGVELVGFSDALDKAEIQAGEIQVGGSSARIVGEISGIAWDGEREVYYGVADRAGEDHSHVFTLDIPRLASGLGTPRVLDVTFLLDENGRSLDGSNFDGEGIVIWEPASGRRHDTASRQWIIASEGGGAPDAQPGIRRFTLEGRLLGDLPVPSRFLIGRNNLSFESLALDPSGTELFTIVEGPLPEDGETGDLRGRLRLLHYRGDTPETFRPVAEYHYQTEPGREPGEVGAVEMIALSGERLLVLERGWVRDRGNTVRIFQVSLEGGHDVSEVASLAVPAAPPPLVKELVVDLARCPPAGATSLQPQPNPLLDNFEAMALGPPLPDGRRSLVLVSDDNRSPFQVTRIVVLSWEME
ncbi:MAG: esterase-like activity of phytase family protein [Gemmatimonadales bacterium]|nr:MAG: esterase-like activity of phytase family protein [Gemmatimonadales bacterium]